jgi:hypothetical protein
MLSWYRRSPCVRPRDRPVKSPRNLCAPPSRDVQRAVILKLLALDDGAGVPLVQLRSRLFDIARPLIAAALFELELGGAIRSADGRLFVSPAALHLHRLDLLAV